MIEHEPPAPCSDTQFIDHIMAIENEAAKNFSHKTQMGFSRVGPGSVRKWTKNMSVTGEVFAKLNIKAQKKCDGLYFHTHPTPHRFTNVSWNHSKTTV